MIVVPPNEEIEEINTRDLEIYVPPPNETIRFRKEFIFDIPTPFYARSENNKVIQRLKDEFLTITNRYMNIFTS